MRPSDKKKNNNCPLVVREEECDSRQPLFKGLVLGFRKREEGKKMKTNK